MNTIVRALRDTYLEKDDRFFGEVFLAEIYNPVRKLGKVDTVIDLGALKGEFSFWVYDQAKKIYAIEPMPTAYADLQENCEGLDKIKTFDYIISNENGHMYIQGLDDGGAVARRFRTGGIPSYEKESRTLATFMKENDIKHVDVLKIDIEDSESDVFKSYDFEQVSKSIDFIIGEHLKPVQEILEGQGFTEQDYQYGQIFKR